MHGASADASIRKRIEDARTARSRVFNDGLAAIFGRAPRSDRWR